MKLSTVLPLVLAIATPVYAGDTPTAPQAAMAESIMKGDFGRLDQQLSQETPAQRAGITAALIKSCATGKGYTPEVRVALIGHLLQNGAGTEQRYENGMTPLMLAAQYGEYAIVQRLLAAGADVHARAEGGETALMFAAGCTTDTGLVHMLLQAGSDVHARDAKGDTPLIHAAGRSSNWTSVLRLLQAGADANETGGDGKTPLIAAALCVDIDSASTLIDAGADVNARDAHGRTPLMCAVKGGPDSKYLCKYFIGKGADVNAKDGDGRTALDLATAMQDTLPQEKQEDCRNLISCLQEAERLAPARAREAQVRAAMLEAAAKGDAEGFLMCLDQLPKDEWRLGGCISAAGRGHHWNVIQAMLDACGNESRRKALADGIMGVAAEGHDVEFVQYLIAGKIGDPTQGLLAAADNGDIAIARMLLDAGAYIHECYDTPLALAAFKGHEDFVRFLLENGADPSACDEVDAVIRNDRSRMCSACSSTVEAHYDEAAWARKLNIVKLMLEHGADPEVGTVSALLDICSRTRQLPPDFRHEVVALILKAGGDPNGYFLEGTTVLMEAADNGDDVLVRLLLEAGATPLAKNEDGMTARAFAEKAAPDAKHGEPYSKVISLLRAAEKKARRQKRN